MDRYNCKFPMFRKNVTNGLVTFSIGNIKSRTPSVAYFILHCYDLHGDEILVEDKPVYVGQRFVVLPSYHEYICDMEIDEEIIHDTFNFQIELILIGVTSENPVYFNKVMFEQSPHTEYHKPAEALDIANIRFNNNNYATLYTNEGKALQVIRPYPVDFDTHTITASKTTVLAPHLENEPETDTPDKLMMEYINQTIQYISIKK